jgi:hypothetical protein
MRMFVVGVNGVYVIVAVFSLIHHAGLKRFVRHMAASAERKCQQSRDPRCVSMIDHDPDGLIQLRSNAVYLLTRLKTGGWTWFV